MPTNFTFSDYRARILDASPWERERILRDAAKHLGWEDVARLARIASATP